MMRTVTGDAHPALLVLAALVCCACGVPAPDVSEPAPAEAISSSEPTSGPAAPTGPKIVAELQALPVREPLSHATVALSADGAQAAVGSLETPIRLWDMTRSEVLADLAGPASGVLALELSADGSLLASAHSDGSVRLWSVPGTEPLRTLEGHPQTWPVLDLDISDDGTRLASGGDYSRAFVWDIATGAAVREISWPAFMEHDEPCPPRKRCYAPELVRRRVICVAFRDGSLLTFSQDGIAEMFDIASGETTAEQQLRGGYREATASPDGTLVAAVVERTGGLVVFDPVSAEIALEITPDPGEEALPIPAGADAVPVNSVAFVSAGALVVTADGKAFVVEL